MGYVKVAGAKVSKALGPTTGAMLKHYVHLDESALVETREALAAPPDPVPSQSLEPVEFAEQAWKGNQSGMVKERKFLQAIGVRA